MQYVNGSGWRNHVKSKLQPMNIMCFDPYDKPFVSPVTVAVVLVEVPSAKTDQVVNSVVSLYPTT